MMKKGLLELTVISRSSLVKMVNNGNAMVSKPAKICEVMDWDLPDIIELVPDRQARYPKC